MWDCVQEAVKNVSAQYCCGSAPKQLTWTLAVVDAAGTRSKRAPIQCDPQSCSA